MKFYLKSMICAIFFLLFNIVSATSYYVSPTGNDSNNGTSQATSWRTIARVNQISSSLQPGDKIFFQKGGTYRGKLTISSSGNASNKIEIGSYGSGNLPIISGSSVVSNWVVYSGNIWSAPISQVVKHIFVNGQIMTLARYPNTGWLRVDQGTPTTINDSELSQASGYWTGATAVIRTTNWSYDTAKVTGFSSHILTHTSTGNDLSNQNWGYFLRNKLNQLDSPGEWFYDSAAGRVYLWCPSSADPNTQLVEASVLDNGIYVSWQKQHIKIYDISFCHQYAPCLYLSGTSNLEVTNCTFLDAYQAIRSTGSSQNFNHLTIQRMYATGVYLLDSNSSFTFNTVRDIATIPGLGESDWGYFGLRISGGTGMVVSDNLFENIGYTAMNVEGNCLMERNIVRAALYTLNDGGAISFDNANGLIIRKNIVENIVGNIESVAPNYSNYLSIAHGIYFGNITVKNTTIDGNTVTNCQGSGIWVDHTMLSVGNQIINNTLFNNSPYQIGMSDYSNYNGPGATSPYAVSTYNDIYNNNILYCLNSTQLSMYHINRWYTGVDFGTFTNNRYWNFWNQSLIQIHRFLPTQSTSSYTMAQWQVLHSDEAGSLQSPLNTQSPQTDHLLIYNTQLSTQVFSIPSGTWSDVYGVLYTGSISIDSFKSKVIYKTTNAVPFLAVKVFLDGPMNWSTMKMNKNLTVPTINPYSALGIPNTSDLLTIPQDSIVDWVLLQLVNTQNQIIESKAFLLKTSGQIVTPSGSNQLTFTQDLVGKKLIIKHRNHLGVMTSQVLSSGQTVDFTLSTTTLYGTLPTKISGTTRALWSGDSNFDGVIKYTGSSNDRDPVLAIIGGTFPTNVIGGYYSEDINMDGFVKYTGQSNDRDPILVSIGGTVPTVVKVAQLP